MRILKMAFQTKTVIADVNDARVLYKALCGVFTIYKPTYMCFEKMKYTLISNLCRDLNNKNVRPPVKYVSIDGPTNSHMRVQTRYSYSDNTLVVGPRYQKQDFILGASRIVLAESSGVVVCGINEGTSFIKSMRYSNFTKFYKVKGLLGQATDTYFHTGKIKERSTYNHVKRGHIDRICNSMQSSHQRKMFEHCGVDIQSQAAYDLAVKGLLRPADRKIPMIYTIRCIDFSPPEFTLEIVCINEDEMYLKTIVHDVGIRLHSTATCTQINCLQDGLFNADIALLKKHWTLYDILSNMQMCHRIIQKNKSVLYKGSPTLMEYDTDNVAKSQKELEP
ncbi:mitochondrial mRNA pseudouridine synthase Trub2 [Colletes gigas]|uniref:mitochondrial mRNA pseudouridine synthase Trub2 n=1 Tax=Colletes gigas TaxID=935657 RepID=UPI001C9AFA27|nr:mitochondrial mRNA pseudouridine synthase Trub2 [Colletes gigas]